MVGAARAIPFRWSFLLGVVVLGALPFVVGQITPAKFGGSPSDLLAAHQAQGLRDPFGQASTLPGHIGQVVKGIRDGISNPLGRGVGSVTIAANKFGGTQSGTEGDPGNAAVAAGILGLAAYDVILVVGFGTVYRVAVVRRDWLSFAAIAMIVVTFLQWLNGGQYAVAFVPWLLLGWADNTLSRHESAQASVRVRVLS
jgi:hypothetical protein